MNSKPYIRLRVIRPTSTPVDNLVGLLTMYLHTQYGITLSQILLNEENELVELEFAPPTTGFDFSLFRQRLSQWSKARGLRLIFVERIERFQEEDVLCVS